jgi:hypothetical protein
MPSARRRVDLAKNGTKAGRKCLDVGASTQLRRRGSFAVALS